MLFIYFRISILVVFTELQIQSNVSSHGLNKQKGKCYYIYKFANIKIIINNIGTLIIYRIMDRTDP